MAFSHLDASVVFPENGAGRAVLISDGFAVVALGVWVDIEGLVMTGLVVGGTRVARWTATGLYIGNDELEDRGVVARSRGLLELGSGAMSSGSQLILGLRWDILTVGGWSCS